MRRVMTSLAIVWLAGLVIIMGWQVSRHAALADVVATPAKASGEQTPPAGQGVTMHGRENQGRSDASSR